MRRVVTSAGRLCNAIAAADDLPASEVLATIRAHLLEFTVSEPQSDDVTLVAFRLTG
jgi:serine phosphatase RsbU (regulator of sigma subunit)